MFDKLPGVKGSQIGASKDEEILRVVFLGGLREVERARDDGGFVNEKHFVVRDCMPLVQPGRNPGVGHKIRCGVLSGFVALVQNDFNVNASAEGFHKGGGYWSRSERIGLHKDALAGGLQLPHDRLCAASLWRKKHFG